MEQAGRALIYCRQSLTREDSDSVSLPMQERESRQYSKAHGWSVIEPVIVDPDVKGWDPARPGITELLARLETERPDVVVVYMMNRFARDYIIQETIWRKIRSYGTRLVSIHEPHAEDDMVRGILGVISQEERKKLGTFLSSAFRERARSGFPHGKTPYGFQKTTEGKLAVNEDARNTIVEMVSRLESGWSLWRVAKWLNETHVDGRTWEPNVVRNTVLTPAIAGAIKCADVLTWDAHEPIITRERYERLCALLASRRTIRTKQAFSWLEGIFHCGCGAPMHLIMERANYKTPTARFRCSADPSREQFQRPRQFPACTFSPRSTTQVKAERFTIDALQCDLSALLDWEDVQQSLKRQYRATESGADQQRIKLERDLKKAETERDRLLALYRRGTLDIERWEREDLNIAGRLANAKIALAALPVAPDPISIRAIGDRLQSTRDAVARIVESEPERIRTILMESDATVTLARDGASINWPLEITDFLRR